MEPIDLPVMVPIQRTEVPVAVMPIRPDTEMPIRPVTEMPLETPQPTDDSRTLNLGVRVFVLIGSLVVGFSVFIACIFMFTRKDPVGPTTSLRKEEALTPVPEKVAVDILTMPPRVKEETKSEKPTIKENTLPSPTQPSSEEKSRAKPVPSDIMLCTVNGEGPDLATAIFDASICGIIIFDSVYKEVRQEVAGIFTKNKKYFLELAKVDQFGKYGISFSLDNEKLAGDVEGNKFNQKIKDMWEKGIRHAAVINIYGDNVNDRNFTVALKALEIAHKTFLEYKSDKPSYVVLGAAIDKTTILRLVGLMRKHFVPSLFIAITHVSYDDRARPDCRILPPTWLDTPENVQGKDLIYGRTLVESCSLLPVVARDVQAPVAISFSLSGHMYKPRFVDPYTPTPKEYGLFYPCKEFDGNYYVSPPELCEIGTHLPNNVQTTRSYVFAFDPYAKKTLTFDNADTLKNKVCAAKEKCQGVPFRLAAYDVEYDAEWTGCDKFGTLGASTRIRLLREMHGYLASVSTANSFNISVCRTHV